jgi:hypothetical protein
LLDTSGWLAFTPLSGWLLLLPLAQTLCALWLAAAPTPTPAELVRTQSATLQRLYQLTLVLLLGSSLLHLLSGIPGTPTVLGLPLALGAWVTRPDDATEIRITPTAQGYALTLRGAFTLVWAPRDGFEKWLFILWVRRLHRVGESTPLLSQAQVAAAFDASQTYVSRWERLVQTHGWHVLSDRFRHQLHSRLPDAACSQAILKVWVSAFWLSAWDVRERLIQRGVLANRAALELDALHALAHHTGFAQVRALLLERFDLQAGHLLAKEHWWLKELLALNERLLTRLERGERLTPQELIAIEPLRLPTPENKPPAEPPPLAAALQQSLFEPVAETAATSIRCTYCGSAEVAPKSKTPRRKTVLDAFGEVQTVPVLRYYCKNRACRYHTFSRVCCPTRPTLCRCAW